MDDPRYPIGRFSRPESISPSDLQAAINIIEQAAPQFRQSVAGWSDEQLDTPYRLDGWNARQVIHHVAESHMNAYIRSKLALTEDAPTIKPYDEGEWAKLPDALAGPVEPSLRLLEGLHERFVLVLRSIRGEQWKRTFNHPERGVVRLDVNTLLYAWHCQHHLAHIHGLSERMGWS